MRKLVWTITVMSLVAVAPMAHATKSSKEEAVGIGTGGVIGAIAGGPVGFIVGAAIGAKLGDTLHKKDDQISTLSSSLDSSRATVSDLEHDVRTLSDDMDTVNAELTKLQGLAKPELVALLQAGIAMDLLFRTDEHTLADTTGGRLAELAGTLATMPDIRVQLDGFADERGDADYNQRLSEMRVEFVRDQLVSAGIDTARINFAAHGEAPAQDETADSFALERRVSLTLFIDNSPSFASNPN
jgi:outer membrane protein OmpA-like peptidoglycan-associated protein